MPRLAHSADAAIREHAIVLAAHLRRPAGAGRSSQNRHDADRARCRAPFCAGSADRQARCRTCAGAASICSPTKRCAARPCAVWRPSARRHARASVGRLQPDLTAEEKQDAIATLASRKEYALELLKAVEKKSVPRTDVSAYIARQLNSLGDKQVTDRLRQVWGEVRQSGPQKQQQLAQI